MPGRLRLWTSAHRLLLLSIALLAWLAATANLRPTRLPSDTMEQARVLSAAGYWRKAQNLYYSALHQDPTNFDLIYGILELDRRLGRISSPLQHHLDALQILAQTQARAQVCEGYALALVNKDYKGAFQRLKPISESEPGLLSARALALAGLGRDDQALACWRLELERGENRQGEFHFAIFCMQRGYPAELRRLLENPHSGFTPSQSRAVRGWLPLQEGRFLEHLRIQLEVLGGREPSALLEAFLIAATWMLLLGQKLPHKTVSAAFGLGFAAAMCLAGPLDAMAWRADGRFLPNEDLGYLFFHVGLLEELTKLAPLLVLWSWGKLRRPADWVLYACLSALGFATAENLGYFSDSTHFSSPLMRFLCCAPGHMLTTAIISYAWARSAGARPGYRLMAVLTALLVMAGWHALYDSGGSSLETSIGLLDALFLGWLLQVVAGIRLSRGLSHSVLPCAITLLAVAFWQIHLRLSTEMADAWLADSGCLLFLLPTFWYTLESTSNEKSIPRCTRLAPRLLALTGAFLVLIPAFPWPLCNWIWPGACLLGSTILCVYFGGVYAIWPGRAVTAPSSPELERLGFLPSTVQAQGGVAEHHWAQRRIWLRWSFLLSALQLTMTSVCAHYGGRDWDFNPTSLLVLWILLGIFNWCLIGPMTHLSPVLLGAWIHPEQDACALVFERGLIRHRGGVVLWSPLSEGYWVTTADVAPWTVYPSGTYLQLCHGLDLTQLLECHLAGMAALGKQPSHVCTDNLDPQFQAYLEAARHRFLAAPLTTTLESLWETARYYGRLWGARSTG